MSLSNLWRNRKRPARSKTDTTSIHYLNDCIVVFNCNVLSIGQLKQNGLQITLKDFDFEAIEGVDGAMIEFHTNDDMRLNIIDNKFRTNKERGAIDCVHIYRNGVLTGVLK